MLHFFPLKINRKPAILWVYVGFVIYIDQLIFENNIFQRGLHSSAKGFEGLSQFDKRYHLLAKHLGNIIHFARITHKLFFSVAFLFWSFCYIDKYCSLQLSWVSALKGILQLFRNPFTKFTCFKHISHEVCKGR